MKKILRKTKQLTRKFYKRYKALLQCCDPLLLSMISNYGLFDSKWYLETNSDVREAKRDPLYHYISSGWLEGRIPFASYSEKLYLQMAPDYIPSLSSPLVDMARRVANGTLSQENLALLKSLDNSTIPHDHHRLYNGITICGFLCSEIGLGQAARNLAYSADIARVNVDFYNLSVPGRDNDTEFATKCGSRIYTEKALFVLPLDANALQLLKKAPGRHLILYPYWELARIPDSCIKFLDLCDEFWAPSSFIKEMFSSFSKPSTLIPQPVKIPSESDFLSSCVNPDIFTVLTYFDIDSYQARKNPMASVKAFQAAFPSDRDVKLIVKLRGSNSKQEIRNKLKRAARYDERITIIDKTITRYEIEQLVMCCNVFISLQRSEGFGFGPAEALAAAKPVITTCYGGVTDFINSHTAYPVSFNLVSVKQEEYPEWEGQVWADPIIDDAVESLRFIKNNPNIAAARGRAGREWMINHHSVEAVGELIKTKLSN